MELSFGYKVIGLLKAGICIIMLFFFFVPYSLLALPVLWLIGKRSEDRRYFWARKLSAWGFWVLNTVAGVKVEMIGMENLPKEPSLIVTNHRSFFDTIAFMNNWPMNMANVAKLEFSKLFTFSIWMRYLNSIFVDRSNPREGLKSINASVEMIKKGYSVWICPEGTRCHTDSVNPFHEGSFKIADKAGCKIVPVAYTNTDDILEKHFPYLKSTRVKAIICKPYETAGLDREQLKEVHQKVYEDVLAAYLKYRD